MTDGEGNHKGCPYIILRRGAPITPINHHRVAHHHKDFALLGVTPLDTVSDARDFPLTLTLSLKGEGILLFPIIT